MDERSPAESSRAERNAAHVAWLASERAVRLRAIARRVGIAAQDLDDVVQSALLGVLRSFPGPDDEAHVYSYAAACVERQARNRRRRIARKEVQLSPIEDLDLGERVRHRLRRELADPEASDPEDLALDRAELETPRELLLELPPAERTALVLRAAGASTEEICRALEVSPRALRKLIGKARRRLEVRRRQLGS